MNRGSAKLSREIRIGVLAVQLADLFDEKLHAFHLDFRSWKTIENSPVTKLGLQHLAQEDSHDLSVSDQLAFVFECFCF